MLLKPALRPCGPQATPSSGPRDMPKPCRTCLRLLHVRSARDRAITQTSYTLGRDTPVGKPSGSVAFPVSVPNSTPREDAISGRHRTGSPTHVGRRSGCRPRPDQSRAKVPTRHSTPRGRHRCIRNKDDTTSGSDDSGPFKGRIEQIRPDIDTAPSDHERRQERLAKLAGAWPSYKSVRPPRPS